MKIRFYFDPETGEPHLHRHGVTEEEAAEVVRHPGEDRPGREGSRIYVPDPEPQSAFVITAYELQGKPLAAYRRRRKRKLT
jgi:hypothetical protein